MDTTESKCSKLPTSQVQNPFIWELWTQLYTDSLDITWGESGGDLKFSTFFL